MGKRAFVFSILIGIAFLLITTQIQDSEAASIFQGGDDFYYDYKAYLTPKITYVDYIKKDYTAGKDTLDVYVDLLNPGPEGRYDLILFTSDPNKKVSTGTRSSFVLYDDSDGVPGGIADVHLEWDIPHNAISGSYTLTVCVWEQNTGDICNEENMLFLKFVENAFTVSASQEETPPSIPVPPGLDPETFGGMKVSETEESSSTTKSSASVSTLSISAAAKSPASTSSTTKTVTSSTGPRSMGPVTIDVDYIMDMKFNRPTKIYPGQSATISITPQNERVGVTVDFRGKSYSGRAPLPMGIEVPVELTTGLEAYFTTGATASASVSGPASLSKTSFSWNSASTKTFTLTVSPNAKPGDTITLRVPVNVRIDVGLNLNLILFKENIAERSLGYFDAYPTISQQIQVVEPPKPKQPQPLLPLAEDVLLQLRHLVLSLLLWFNNYEKLGITHY